MLRVLKKHLHETVLLNTIENMCEQMYKKNIYNITLKNWAFLHLHQNQVLIGHFLNIYFSDHLLIKLSFYLYMYI